MSDKEYYQGSDGNLEYYPQIYKPTDDEVEAAQKLEQYIIEQQQNIQGSFLKMGAALLKFENDKLYLARGVPNFQSWVSEHCDFSYAWAKSLIRIVRDLLPVLGEVEEMPSVSTMRELLPMLSEGRSQAEIREAFEEVQGLTVRDAKHRLRELRGIEEPPIPTTFRARVQEREDFVLVTISRFGDDGDIYDLTSRGPLYIKKKDWPRWQDRFGVFIEFRETT